MTGEQLITQSMENHLLDRPLLLLDGGLGTALEEEKGICFTDDTPLWSSHLLVSSPETLLEVHSGYATAGADVLLTATYQASFHGFEETLKGISNKDIAKVPGWEAGDDWPSYSLPPVLLSLFDLAGHWEEYKSGRFT